MLGDCLESARWADELIVIDTGSGDGTVKIAQRKADRVISLPFKSYQFSAWRNLGIKKATGDWLFYLDADERITPLLKKEILGAINRHQKRDSRISSLREKTAGSRKTDCRRISFGKIVAYSVPRRNFYLGREMKFGGAWPDYVIRLFKKKNLKKWRHRLHEQPRFEGDLGKFQNPLIHLTHRDLTSMLEKTIDWTEIEAGLLFKADHPPVVWWRIFRMMMTKFWQRFIRQQAYRDGTEGFINSLFEVFNTFIIYARLWEKQRRPDSSF